MAGVPTNAEAATTLRRLADLLAIGGEPIYRVAAYRRAAESIEALPEAVAALRARGELESINGVGKGIAQSLEELIDTGRLGELDAAAAVIPIGVTELLAVPDVGPKRARQLYQHLGIDSLADLRQAVETGRLAEVPGLGPKGAQRIADGLRSMVDPDQRLPLPVARRLGLDVIDQLRQRAPGIERIELAGSIRRFRETIGDLDIVAAAEDPPAVVEALATLPIVTRVEMQGPNRCRVILQNGQAADLRVLPIRHWGSLLHHFTGSKYHNIHLRDIAIERGWSMSEYGYKRGDELVPCATEEEVYAFLEMEFIPPPMREETGEIELALQRRVAARLGVRRSARRSPPPLDLERRGRQRRGDGPGGASRAATTTSASPTTPWGSPSPTAWMPERLVAQRDEIDRANAELAPFRVLQGVEVEVRGDGSLDLPDEVLAGLDLVIASVHIGLPPGRRAHRPVAGRDPPPAGRHPRPPDRPRPRPAGGRATSTSRRSSPRRRRPAPRWRSTARGSTCATSTPAPRSPPVAPSPSTATPTPPTGWTRSCTPSASPNAAGCRRTGCSTRCRWTRCWGG